MFKFLAGVVVGAVLTTPVSPERRRIWERKTDAFIEKFITRAEAYRYKRENNR